MHSATAPAHSHDYYLLRPYVGELDGVRAVAVLLVMAHHVKWDLFRFTGGHYGVVLFFVLSGYLITTLCLREEAATGRVSLAAFYVRRTFRIFPLYYLVLALYAVLLLGFHIHAEWEAEFRAYWPGYLFYYQELVREWTDGRMPFVHSWTLGVEEKFYLIWPLIGFVLLRGGFRRYRGAFTAVAVVTLFIASPVLTAGGYPTLGRCLQPYPSLLCGCGLALVLHHPVGYSYLAAVCRPGVGLALTAAMIAAQTGVDPAEQAGFGQLWWPIYTAVATAWVGALVVRDGPVQRLLRSGRLTRIGRLSYGIYLVHLLLYAPVHKVAERLADPAVRGAFTLLAGLALSALVASVLAVTVETPMIRAGRRLSAWIMRRNIAGAQPTSRTEHKAAAQPSGAR